MAGTTESMSTIKLSLRVRWWVKPFLFLAYVAVVPFAHVVDLEAYIARVAALVVRYGYVIRTAR